MPCLLEGIFPCIGALVFLCGAHFSAAATQETPLDHLVLRTRRACIHESHRTVATGEMVLGRLPPLGHSGLRHTLQSFCEEAFFAYLRASA